MADAPVGKTSAKRITALACAGARLELSKNVVEMTPKAMPAPSTGSVVFE
jgi:hypothetical protein